MRFTAMQVLLLACFIFAQGDFAAADATEATEVVYASQVAHDASLGISPQVRTQIGEAAGTQTAVATNEKIAVADKATAATTTSFAASTLASVDLCGGSPVKVCDPAFQAADFGTNSGAQAGFPGLRLLRYKCTCKTCLTPATCTSKCSRGGAAGIFVYFEFRAGYCKNLNGNTKLTVANRKTYNSQISALFVAHGQEKLAVTATTEELLTRSNTRRSSMKNSLGDGAKTMAGGTTDYTLPTFPSGKECAIVNYNQLNSLMNVGNGGHSSIYTDFRDYMRKEGKKTVYGLPADCIHNVGPMASWSYPQDEPKLSDGRTGRTLLQFGGPNWSDWVAPFGVLSKDVNKMNFIVMEFPEVVAYLTQKGRAGRDNRNKYKSRTGLQVAICPDGSVKGVTAVKAGGVDSTACGGKATYAKIDALFREAVAFARFKLSEKWATHISGINEENWQNSRRRDIPYASASSPCKAGNWDGIRCLNEIFGPGYSGNNGGGGLSLSLSLSRGGKAAYCNRIDEGRRCFLVDLVKVSGANGMMDMGFASVGFISDGGFMGKGGIRKKSVPVNLLKSCNDGGTRAGKCTVKVCQNTLRIKLHPDIKLTVSWKSPLGSTITKKVDEASWRRRRSKWEGDKMDTETIYEWDGTEVTTAVGHDGNSKACSCSTSTCRL